MLVKLSNIRSATPRVRKELDLDKLDELAESIRETGGVIVPVKLKANGEDGYVTVYGHRRIEACRMAGLAEVEAFIVEVDDEDLLTQALIENVVREDMSPLDVAKSLNQARLENDWTYAVLATTFGMSKGTVGEYLALLKPDFKELVEDSPGEQIGIGHIREARAGTKSDDDAIDVLKKASAEGLSKPQIRKVAEAVSAAPNPDAKKKLLEQEYNPFIHDADRIKEQAKRTPGKDPVVQKPRPKADAAWKDVPEVAVMLESLRKIENDLVPSFIKLVEIGKLDKSGNAFVAGKVRRVVRSLERLIDVL